MAKWKHILIGSGILAGFGGLVTYGLRLRKMSAELESSTKASVHSIGLNGLVIRVDVLLKNPTRTGFKIKFPFVKLVYNGTTIGSSEVINRDISVPAQGQVNISQIMISLPAISLLTTAGKLLAAVAEKKAAAITVKTITTLDLGWKKLPYEKTDNIQISGSKTA